MTQRMAVESPDSPMLRCARMTGLGGAEKRLLKFRLKLTIRVWNELLLLGQPNRPFAVTAESC